MVILVSNDDGIHSEGIHALEEALSTVGEVYTVAPDRERNAVSHALTLHRPLRIDELSRHLKLHSATVAAALVTWHVFHFTQSS